MSVIASVENNVDDPPAPFVEAPEVSDPTALRAAAEDLRATIRHIIDYGQSGPEIDAAVAGIVTAVKALHDLTVPAHAAFATAHRAWRIEVAQRQADRAQAAVTAIAGEG